MLRPVDYALSVCPFPSLYIYTYIHTQTPLFQINEALQGGDFVLFRTCKQMIKVQLNLLEISCIVFWKLF